MRKAIASPMAIFMASSRSAWKPITIQCVGVSAIGRSSVMSLRTTNSSSTSSKYVSHARQETSPSPWSPWASAAMNSAPSTFTGTNSELPATSSLLSMFPAK